MKDKQIISKCANYLYNRVDDILNWSGQDEREFHLLTFGFGLELFGEFCVGDEEVFLENVILPAVEEINRKTDLLVQKESVSIQNCTEIHFHASRKSVNSSNPLDLDKNKISRKLKALSLMLKGLDDSYTDFVDAIISYTEEDTDRIDEIIDFVLSGDHIRSSDVVKFVSDQSVGKRRVIL